MCVCVFMVFAAQGRVLSWGRADYGQLGLAKTAEVQSAATTPLPNFVSTPSEVVGLRGICQVREASLNTLTANNDCCAHFGFLCSVVVCCR